MKGTPEPSSSLSVCARLSPLSSCLSHTGEPRRADTTTDVASRVKHRGRITSLYLLAVLFLRKPRKLLAFLATRVHCQFTATPSSQGLLCTAPWAPGCTGADIPFWPTGPGSLSSTNEPSAPSPRPSMKMWNSSGPSAEPWGTPLLTGLQLDITQPSGAGHADHF